MPTKRPETATDVKLGMLQDGLSRVELRLEKQDQVLWKGGNGVPPVVPSVLSALRWIKVVGGIASAVLVAIAVQVIQQRMLINVQEDIRHFTLEAAKQASAAKVASEENRSILEEKIVPQVEK